MGAKSRQRLVRCAAAGAAALAGCAGPSIGNLPTDAATSISSFVANAQDAERASRALGWKTTTLATRLASKPSDVQEFKAAVCEPPLFDAFIASRAFQSFNEDVAELAKAPESSLGSYIRAINEHRRQLREIGMGAKPPVSAADLRAKLIRQCGPLVDRDLALATPGAPESQDSPALAIDAILALAKFVTSAVALAEKQSRAEVVRAYVIANEASVRQALEVLATTDGLGKVVQVTRSYYVRRAFAAYSDLAGVRAASARPNVPSASIADEYAQLVAKYLKLQNIDSDKLLSNPESGMRPAYEKFIQQIKQPDSDPYVALDNFLGFLNAISEINSNRQGYLKALKDMQGGGS